MSSTAPEPDWHIIAGDWKPLDRVFGQRAVEEFWSRAGWRFMREFGDGIQRESFTFSALVLPFYSGSDFTWALVEVRLPPDIDAVGLLRWAYFLWDGNGDATLLDGSSQTIHVFNERVGIALGTEDEQRSRAALYLALLTAFLAGEAEPRIERDDVLERPGEFDVAGSTEGHDYFRSPFLLVAAGGHQSSDLPVPAAADELTEPLDKVTQNAGADTQTFASRGVDDKGGAYLCLYRQRLFRSQFSVVFGSRDGSGRWRSAVAKMIEDQAVESPVHWKPVFYSLRPGTIAFVCADPRGMPEKIEVSPARMAALLRSPHFRGACRGNQEDLHALLPDGAEREQVRAALRLLAMNWWQAPVGRSRIDVMGDLLLARPGEELSVPIEAEGPVRLWGHLEFRNARLRAPLRLRRWLIAGRIDGQNARAQSAIALQDVTVRNVIPKGLRKEGFQTVQTLPNKAVKLDELRSEGSIDLRALRAVGQVSLRSSGVEGRVSLDGVQVSRHPTGSDDGVVFDSGRFGAVQMIGSKVEGRVSAAQARIDADLDLDRLSAAGVDARRAGIGGRLSLHGAILHGTAAVLDGEEAHVAGSLDLTEASVSSKASPAPGKAHIVLRRARVDGELDASGLCVMGQWISDRAIDAESLQVGGDFVLNRIEPIAAAARSKAPENLVLMDLYPTLIKGSVELTNAVVKGSFMAYWVHVSGDLQFRAAQVGKDLVVSGLLRANPELDRAVPLLASASYVGGVGYRGGARGELNLYQARIGGNCDLAGAVCGSLELSYARIAGGLYARPSDGTRLPLYVLPADSGGEVSLSAAEIFNIDIEGMQCGRPLRAVSLQTRARIRLGPAMVPAPTADAEAIQQSTEALLQVWVARRWLRVDDKASEASLRFILDACGAVLRKALRDGGRGTPSAGPTPPPDASETRLGMLVLVHALGRIAVQILNRSARQVALEAFWDAALVLDSRQPAATATRWAAVRRLVVPLIRAWRDVSRTTEGIPGKAILRLLDAVDRAWREALRPPDGRTPGVEAAPSLVSTTGLAEVFWKALVAAAETKEVEQSELLRAFELIHTVARVVLARMVRTIRPRTDEPSPIAISTRIGGYVRMVDLKCGGGFELPGIACKSIELRNARIDGDLRLRLDDDKTPAAATKEKGEHETPRATVEGDFEVRNTTVTGATVLDGAHLDGTVRVDDTRLQGGLHAVDAVVKKEFSIRNSAVAGASDLRHVTVGGLDIADSRIDGAFTAEFATFGDGTEAGGPIRINNVRTQADVAFRGVSAGECRIEDSTIGGDLRLLGGSTEPSSAKQSGATPRKTFSMLAVTGCRIEGRLQMDGVAVEGDIDLSDSHAVRGLQIGAASDAVADGAALPERTEGANR